eukprot:9961513-Alexandrium_andersonii.AAC.1
MFVASRSRAKSVAAHALTMAAATLAARGRLQRTTQASAVHCRTSAVGLPEDTLAVADKDLSLSRHVDQR